MNETCTCAFHDVTYLPFRGSIILRVPWNTGFVSDVWEGGSTKDPDRVNQIRGKIPVFSFGSNFLSTPKGSRVDLLGK